MLVIQLLHKHQLTKLCAVCSRILFNLIRAREGIEDSFCWKIPWTQFLAPGKLYKLSETYIRSICKTFSLSGCALLQMFSCAIGNGRNQCYAYSRRLQGWAFVINRPDRAWKYQGKTCKSSPIFFLCDSVILFPDHKTFMSSTKFVVESSEIRTFQLCYNLL